MEKTQTQMTFVLGICLTTVSEESLVLNIKLVFIFIKDGCESMDNQEVTPHKSSLLVPE